MTLFPLVLRSINQQAVIELDELSTILDTEGTVLNKTSIDPALIELTILQERSTL